jgi:hypothetical protein
VADNGLARILREWRFEGRLVAPSDEGYETSRRIRNGMIDNLLSADMVMADGEMPTASLEQNTDLFRAVRG